jgi:hypothetical protein
MEFRSLVMVWETLKRSKIPLEQLEIPILKIIVSVADKWGIGWDITDHLSDPWGSELLVGFISMGAWERWGPPPFPWLPFDLDLWFSRMTQRNRNLRLL